MFDLDSAKWGVLLTLSMTSEWKISPDVRAVLESVKTGVLIIDAAYRVRFVNQTVRDIINKSWPTDGCDVHCFSYLLGREEPCEDCLLKTDPLSVQQKSATIKKNDGSDVFVRFQVSPYGDGHVITVLDITREVSLLRKIDLNRKEQQAKNVLLERRRQQALDEQRQIKELIDHLPEALLTVDSDFVIEGQNRSVAEMLSPKAAQKCYQLLGGTAPCRDCPAVGGFAALDDVKKMHQLGKRYVTESISRSPLGAGGLLLFRDTTRQIQLIEKIREQRQTLTSLAELGALMQKVSDLESVVDHFLDLFLSVLKKENALLVINDIRPATIWLVSRRGVCPEDALKKVTRAYLSRNFQGSRQSELHVDMLPWPETRQFVLRGRNGALVGLLLLEGVVQVPEEKEMADLFVEPLGIYLDNRLLSRKLEEKANTDPLTGLYNRGYFEQALLEEKEKFCRFNMNFAVIAADVNRLKKANDDYGHEAGDRLILKVSELLRKNVRATDILARTGGDEFVILLTDCDSGKLRRFIERLNGEIFQGIFIEVGENEQFPVTVSFGGAATDTCAIEMLMHEADKEMYAAKEKFYQKELRYR